HLRTAYLYLHLSIAVTHYPPLLFLFFNDTSPTEIYTLSLHDALPISYRLAQQLFQVIRSGDTEQVERLLAMGLVPNLRDAKGNRDRKSTRLNSSHVKISYAVFCLKKKKKK